MKIIGSTLVRHVNNSHFLIKYRAYCFDVSIIESIEEDWKKLRIITPTGRVYEISKEGFFTNAKVNSEFGKTQYILPTSCLKLVKNISSKSVVISEDVHANLKNEAKNRNTTISQLLKDKYGSNSDEAI